MADNVERIEDYGLSKKDRPKTLFSKVGIVGCGTTGQNIARMVSSKGMEVVFLELTDQKIEEAYKGIERDLDSMINRWGMTESEKRAIMSRIKGTKNYNDFKGCDMVIEAILSKTREKGVDVRKVVFRNIEKHVCSDCIIATNASSLVITELSAELEHKDRCVSFHFSATMSPESKTVEIAKSLYTTEEAYERVLRFAKLLSKTVIPVEESPGLISVRMIVAMINEACEVLMESVGTQDDIDSVMKTGLGLPLGPFETADKIGLDRVVRWMDNLYSEFGEVKYKASPIIKRLVRAHQFGRKTGKGFYKYDESGRKITAQPLLSIEK